VEGRSGEVCPGSMSIRVGAALSLTGRYAAFGREAAAGLEAWRRLRSDVALAVEDDESRREGVRAALRGLAGRCDVLLGPYSTHLARAAAEVAADLGLVVWNHGGAGDDVQAMAPGHLVSVLTPAGRYGEPLVGHLAEAVDRAPLWVVAGAGSFGRQVAAGLEAEARRAGLEAVRRTAEECLRLPAPWLPDLASAGSFEEDVELLVRMRGTGRSPRSVWAVAAGVQQFAAAVRDPAGMYGPAQWLPGVSGRPTAGPGEAPAMGPSEADFLGAYADAAGGVPDYPAAQAAAAAALAVHSVEVAGSAERSGVWRAAVGLDTSTFFGRFRVDAETGAQLGHQVALVRWTEGRRMVRHQ
jgi:ABC-type branched-subunit amino acid transport system substrate-binding protein